MDIKEIIGIILPVGFFIVLLFISVVLLGYWNHEETMASIASKICKPSAIAKKTEFHDGVVSIPEER